MSGSFTRVRIVFDDSVQLPEGEKELRRAVVFVPSEASQIADLEYLVQQQHNIEHPVRLELEGGFYLKSNQQLWFVVKESDVLMSGPSELSLDECQRSNAWICGRRVKRDSRESEDVARKDKKRKTRPEEEHKEADVTSPKAKRQKPSDPPNEHANQRNVALWSPPKPQIVNGDSVKPAKPTAPSDSTDDAVDSNSSSSSSSSSPPSDSSSNSSDTSDSSSISSSSSSSSSSDSEEESKADAIAPNGPLPVLNIIPPWKKVRPPHHNKNYKKSRKKIKKKEKRKRARALAAEKRRLEATGSVPAAPAAQIAGVGPVPATPNGNFESLVPLPQTPALAAESARNTTTVTTKQTPEAPRLNWRTCSAESFDKLPATTRLLAEGDIVVIRIWEPNARWTPELSAYKVIRVLSSHKDTTGLIQFEVLRDLNQDTDEPTEGEALEAEELNSGDLNWFTKRMQAEYTAREEMWSAIDVVKDFL